MCGTRRGGRQREPQGRGPVAQVLYTHHGVHRAVQGLACAFSTSSAAAPQQHEEGQTPEEGVAWGEHPGAGKSLYLCEFLFIGFQSLL